MISSTASPAPVKKIQKTTKPVKVEEKPISKTEIFGQNRPQSSKQFSYIGKKPVNSQTTAGPKDVEPGPQSYHLNYKIAENAPKGGGFGPTREKFLERN